MRSIALAALALAVGAAILSPMLTYPFGSDQGSFAAVADVIARGGVPYQDVWENKPPGVYYLFWLAFSMFGRSMLSVRLLDLLFTLGAAAALFAMARRIFSPAAAWPSAFFLLVFYALGFDFWHTAQADGFGSLPITVALLLALVAEERGSKLLALSSGLLIGLGVVFKFTLAAALVVPVALALSARRHPVPARWARAAGYLAGLFLAVAVVALLVWRAGALKDMLYIVFTWNSQYGHIQPPASKLLVIPYQIGRLHLGAAFVILKLIGLLCLVGLADTVIRRRALPRWWVAPLWWAAMLASVCVQAKYFAYHWLPALPPLALLAGDGYSALLRWTRRLAGEKRAALAVGVLVVIFFGAFAHGYWIHFRRPIAYAVGRLPADTYLADFTTPRGYFSFPADLALGRYIRQHSQPNTPIFVWGLEALVYFLADRPPATRFIHSMPLLTPWSPPEWRRELVRDLARNRPQFVLVAHNDAQPWVTLWSGDSASALPFYPELAHFILSDYRLAERIEDFEVWERK